MGLGGKGDHGWAWSWNLFWEIYAQTSGHNQNFNAYLCCSWHLKHCPEIPLLLQGSSLRENNSNEGKQFLIREEYTGSFQPQSGIKISLMSEIFKSIVVFPSLLRIVFIFGEKRSLAFCHPRHTKGPAGKEPNKGFESSESTHKYFWMCKPIRKVCIYEFWED